jgi:chromosome segregation ATPase
VYELGWRRLRGSKASSHSVVVPFFSCFFLFVADTVMHNLQMLEQQQVNARQKLLESRQIKAQDIELQKQLHLLLEGKKFANGQARGELDKYRDFLSFASRKLGDRKRSSAQLDSDINDFHSRLDNGIKSAKMIKVTGFMIDSILAAVQKKVQALSLMEDKCSIALKSEIDKYEKAKHEEQRLRSSIHKWQSDAQKWAGQNKTLSDEVAKLEIDKTDVQTKEEDSKNELRCIRDDIKEEEKRFAKLEEAKTAEVNESRRQLNILLEEVTIVEGTLGSVEATLQNEKLQTFDCVIVEGWTMEDESDPEEFKAAITSSETAMESEFHARQCKFSACELELQEMEKELESIENCTNERETSLEAIQSQVEAIKETEEMQQLEAAEVERQLANDRTEMQELESKYQRLRSQCYNTDTNIKRSSTNGSFPHSSKLLFAQ